MRLCTVLTSVLSGLRACLFEREVRRLAVKPWLVGLVMYPLTVIAALSFYSPLLAWMSGNGTGPLGTVWFSLAIILTALILLLASVMLTTTLVLTITALLQSSIAELILLREGIPLPRREQGFPSILRNTVQTATTESIKLLWILPASLLAFTLSLFPVVSPLGFLVSAWLIGYQFVDIVLDTLSYRSSFERVRFGLQHTPLLITFGALLLPLAAIPFAAVFLTPVATAGAAIMLARCQILTHRKEEFLPHSPTTRQYSREK